MVGHSMRPPEPGRAGFAAARRDRVAAPPAEPGHWRTQHVAPDLLNGSIKAMN